jgi:hypothetical protein
MAMLREWTHRDYHKLWLTGNLKEGKNEVVPEETGEMGYIYSNEWRDGIYTAMSGEMGYIQP